MARFFHAPTWTRTHTFASLPLVIILLVTGARITGLWFNQTDLFVDESQYWLWGQNLDFGYYSKPPLIAWVIAGATDLAGSDTQFAIRLPTILFHAVTAWILGLIARDLAGPREQLVAVCLYLSMPAVALGSLLMSTDTILAPFFALCIWSWVKMSDRPSLGLAVVMGVSLGLGFLAKYAAVYFVIGAVGAWLIHRPFAGRYLLVGIFCALIALLPNILWNLNNDLATFDHTLDNASWVRDTRTAVDFVRPLSFVGSQLGVFGPVSFCLLALTLWRSRLFGLGWFIWPAIAIVSFQAALADANANWAVMAYLAGSVGVALHFSRGWLIWLAVGINGLLSVTLLMLSLFAPVLKGADGSPFLRRYLGQEETSAFIVEQAHRVQAVAIVAKNRAILADLKYRDFAQGYAIYSVPPTGRAKNFYQQTMPVPQGLSGTLIWVTRRDAPDCAKGTQKVPTFGTTYQGLALSAHVLDGPCFNAAIRSENN